MSESCRSCPSTLRVKYTLFPFVAIHYALQGSSNFWGTIQMKATEQFFPVVLFIILYKVVLTFESVDQWNSMVWLFKSKQLKVLSRGTVYYTVQGGSNCWVWGWNPLWCDHSSQSNWAVLSCGTVYYAVQGGSHFWVCGWNPKVWPFKWKLLSSTFLWYCLLCCTR